MKQRPDEKTRRTGDTGRRRWEATRRIEMDHVWVVAHARTRRRALKNLRRMMGERRAARG